MKTRFLLPLLLVLAGCREKEPAINPQAVEQESDSDKLERKKRLAAIRQAEADEVVARQAQYAKDLKVEQEAAMAQALKDKAEGKRSLAQEVRESADDFEMVIIANRQDGLIVRPLGGQDLYFIPHTKSTRRRPVGETFEGKGFSNGATYRTNGITVLRVISLLD